MGRRLGGSARDGDVHGGGLRHLAVRRADPEAQGEVAAAAGELELRGAIVDIGDGNAAVLEALVLGGGRGCNEGYDRGEEELVHAISLAAALLEIS